MARSGASGAGHRGRMRDQAIQVHRLITERRSITITELAEELGASQDTARRWVDAFSDRLPIRVDRGVIHIADDDG